MNTEQKTIRQWFETIKDYDVKNRALLNCPSFNIDKKVENLCYALMSFAWTDTPEGYKYWNAQYQKALNDEL